MDAWRGIAVLHKDDGMVPSLREGWMDTLMKGASLSYIYLPVIFVVEESKGLFEGGNYTTSSDVGVYTVTD